MRTALTLARRGLGRVWPNPAVGCVLVREGLVVGRGWTAPGGRPHAETEALARAGDLAKGATAYVSLEPCAHHGTTPPCAEALVEAGITRTVIATRDPDPRVSGRGIAVLEAAGTATEVGLLEAEARDLNAGFFSRIERGRPLVTLKLATSIDECIARPSAADGTIDPWITGEAARARGHLMRAQYDAILVGVGTVLADDPTLTCRLPGLEDRSPVRVVLDSRGDTIRLPATSTLVRSASETPLWLVTASDGGEALEKMGVDIIRVADMEDLGAILGRLAERGLTRLLVEGGATVHESFLAKGLADRLAWFRAPVEIGAGGLKAAGRFELANLVPSGAFSRHSTEQLGQDVLEMLVATV